MDCGRGELKNLCICDSLRVSLREKLSNPNFMHGYCAPGS